ncbi:flagellar biosynthetic protein FliQ [Vibrio aquaticus]|uniref:Flagellar biosynthetic protein FliQ n=1 Tax=Vibrio aquaticus TaxID=2496559 RepID=A0A432CXJ0_9VIBR|nr:flagellar biosynthetic protein FliQ [Vibrio aquaticus]RTZ16639.1 flagellar biosynthetic protein FliQ [Vibrio aquaticus]
MSVFDITAACFDLLKDSILLFSVAFVITGVTVGLIQTVLSIQDPGLPLVAKLIVLMLLISQQGSGIYERFQSLFFGL